MKLTEGEKNILHGSEGDNKAEYMRILTQWGEAMGAERLVPVESVQVSGISAPGKNLKGLPEHIVKQFRSKIESFCMDRVKTNVCSHIARITLDHPIERNLDLEEKKFHEQLINKARNAGIKLTFSCAPYLVGEIPIKNQICAWTESSAVVYINSIFGARTARNGTESAISSAVLGLTPAFGPILDKGRKGDLVINVEANLTDVSHWGALGYYAGKNVGIGIPVINNIKRMNPEEAKQLCAAVATSGGAPMLHVVGITPEAFSLDQIIESNKRSNYLTFKNSDLEETLHSLRAVDEGPVDWVLIGCPHASLTEVAEVMYLLDGKKVNEHVNFELWLPYAIKAMAERLGYVSVLEQANVKVLSDSCPLTSRERTGNVMVTNSFKQAHYSQALLGNQVNIKTTIECVNIAIRGCF